jgi:hypothetical protein
MASAAEERIRAKAEALLRQHFPGARIIHELVLQQGKERIDLAAVTADMIAVVEIKSERDVLTRLPEQVKKAERVADVVIVCIAAAHAAKVEAMKQWGHEDYWAAWHNVELLTEQEDGFHARWGMFSGRWMGGHPTPKMRHPAHRLDMLWAAELQAIAQRPRENRTNCIRHICETMTGREIRQAVCAALRARPFPRADAPVADRIAA